MYKVDLSSKILKQIPEYLKDKTDIIKLDLGNNKITKIENLPPNLQELNLSYNEITKIENLPPNLQRINFYGNKITKIENLPSNLHVLKLAYNKITKIENLPPNLQILHLSDNTITKINNLPHNLHNLYINYNKITKIENLPPNLQQLTLISNKITEIPLELLELRQLQEFRYSGNPIENFHHPLIQRWLNRWNQRITQNNQVYADGQNIHNSNIQKSFRKSLESIMKDSFEYSFDICMDSLMKSELVCQEVKQEILNYCEDPMEHSVYLITFKELFHYVFNRILKHKETDELMRILNEEIKETICKCFTGRMTRLLNVLNGFYEDIQIQIGTNEQINNIIIMLMKKYSGKELCEKFIEEMKEREYDEETINHWKQFLE